MPIIQAFKGTVTVKGVSQNGETSYYLESKTAFGETIGELLDNLVHSSVSMADNAFMWAAMHKPANYTPAHDRWEITLTHPDVLESEAPDLSHLFDISNSGPVKGFDDIVKFCVLMRDVRVQVALDQLMRLNNTSSQLPARAETPHHGIYDVTVFSEMKKYGWTGEELDSALIVAKEEGRLQSYHDSIAINRSYHAKSQNAREMVSISSTPPVKKKWWS